MSSKNQSSAPSAKADSAAGMTMEEMVAKMAEMSAMLSAATEKIAALESKPDLSKIPMPAVERGLADDSRMAEDDAKAREEAFSMDKLPEGCIWMSKGGNRMAVNAHPDIVKQHVALGWEKA